MTRLLVVASVAAAAALAIASAAGAAAPQPQTITCGTTDLTLLVGPAVGTQDNENVDVWGAARIVAGGDGVLIPVSFTFTAVDTTLDPSVTLFSGTDAKGDGAGNRNQQTVSCSQSQTGTLADVLGADALPPELAGTGAQLTDTVVLTFTVTAIPKP